MMRFTLTQLEAFTNIVEVGTFQGAAKRLHVTQPTISQRIRELEIALGVTLFIRNGPQFHLTPEGRALIDYAHRMLGTADELRHHYQSRNSLQGTVRLGVSNLFGMLCLSDLLRRLAIDYPGLKLSVRLNDSSTLAHLLENNDLDVAILLEPNLPSQFRQVSVGYTRYQWFAAASVRLPPVLRPPDLAHMQVIVYPPPSRLHGVVMSWFSAAGIEPSRVITCNNFTVTIQTIVSGLAIGVLPRRAMQTDYANGRLCELNVAPALPLHRTAICHRSTRLGVGVEVVVSLMRDLITEHRLFEK